MCQLTFFVVFSLAGEYGSKREKLETAYPHLKMTNIESVSICGNANLEENYFGVQFITGEYIEIGKEKLITI